jgi:FkbM family methyltransferase
MQGTGLPRIAEYIRRQVATSRASTVRESNYWISDFMGEIKICCDLSEHMGSQIFFRGAYSFDQLMLIKALASEPLVFVDVGANQGEFALFVASLSEKNHVLAFEPTRKMLERLQSNISANNFTNVTVMDFGLSNTAQDNVPIYGQKDSFEDGTYHAGLPTIFSMSDRHTVLEQISLRTLDDTLAQRPPAASVDLVKVDAEGAELRILEGAEKTIATDRPVIIFEANSHSAKAAGYNISDLYAWLESRNYELHEIAPGGRYANLDRARPFCNVIGIPIEADLVKTKLRSRAILN